MLREQLALAAGFGIVAVLILFRMMRQRQLVLIGLLKEYVERQGKWARRRAKAEAIQARELAEAAKKAGQAG